MGNSTDITATTHEAGHRQPRDGEGVAALEHGAGDGDRDDQEHSERVRPPHEVEEPSELHDIEGELAADLPRLGVAPVRGHQGKHYGHRRQRADDG